jgi:pyruvate dehydrogenase E2 component (dihydrolipoamide acetyltransferase)
MRHAPSTPAPRARARRGGFDPAQMRQAIAAAMARSKREIPHYYLSSTIDFAAASDWLEAYNREPRPGRAPAAGGAAAQGHGAGAREVPQLNGFHENGAYRPGPGIHIGWAIALRGGGLVAPAIHDADRKARCPN